MTPTTAPTMTVGKGDLLVDMDVVLIAVCIFVVTVVCSPFGVAGICEVVNALLDVCVTMVGVIVTVGGRGEAYKAAVNM